MQRKSDRRKQGRDTVKGVMLISQISYSMLAPIAVGGVIGYFLDRFLGTTPWIMLVFLFAGIVAGYQGVWRLVKGYTDTEPETEKATVQAVDTKRLEAEAAFEQWKKAREGEDKGVDHE